MTTANQPLRDKIALVTGASRGFGRAVAESWAAAGAHVLLLGRTLGALEEVDDAIQAKGGSATIIPLDLKELEAIDQLGPAIMQRWGRLDLWLGNAAQLGALTPLSHYQPKQWHEVLTVNLSAYQRQIATLEPVLKKSPAARAFIVSSGIVQHPTAYWGAYGVSKAGLEHLSAIWAAEMQNTSNLQIHLVNPGIMATRMRANAFPGEDANQLPNPADKAAALLKLLLQPALPFQLELV